MSLSTRILSTLSGGALAATMAGPLTVLAQTEPSTAVLTAEAAIASLPDPERYRLELSNDGLNTQQRQDLGSMLIDTIGGEHYFGAIYAFLPRGSAQLSIHLRRKLHTLEAAERFALDDCEAERRDGDAACTLIGRIVPEDWEAGDTSLLSHEAVFAFMRNVDGLKGSKVVARSRNTTAFAIWSSEGVRQKALDECNDSVRAGGFEPDCDVVIDDDL